jgi:hypothetical protein
MPRDFAKKKKKKHNNVSQANIFVNFPKEAVTVELVFGVAEVRVGVLGVCGVRALVWCVCVCVVWGVWFFLPLEAEEIFPRIFPIRV